MELNDGQKEKLKEWRNKFPKRLSKVRYMEWLCFSHSSGIGWAVKARREYDNGEVYEKELTDYAEW